jgi:hypothetical protein
MIVIAGLLPIGSKALLLDFKFLRILVITLTISTAAYFLTDRGIVAFKQRLCDKNLFGKDLNKLGEQKTKEKVPEGLGIVPAIIFILVTI